MQDGLPQRMQERTNGPQPGTKRKRRQLTLTGPGTKYPPSYQMLSQDFFSLSNEC